MHLCAATTKTKHGIGYNEKIKIQNTTDILTILAETQVQQSISLVVENLKELKFCNINILESSNSHNCIINDATVVNVTGDNSNINGDLDVGSNISITRYTVNFSCFIKSIVFIVIFCSVLALDIYKRLS